MQKSVVRTAMLGIAVLLGAALAACSGGGKDAAGKQGQITVGFSQVGAESEWRTANTASVKRATSRPA